MTDSMAPGLAVFFYAFFFMEAFCPLSGNYLSYLYSQNQIYDVYLSFILMTSEKTNGDFNYVYENRFSGRMQDRKETGFRIHRDPHAAETTTPVKDAAY